MKNCILSAFCVFTLNTNAQFLIKENPFPNTVVTQGNYLYMSQTEVSNLQYREFLNYLKNNKQLNEVNLNYPDTTVWDSKFTQFKPLQLYYFTHPAYNNYPVVGVTQEQAMVYCKWIKEQLIKHLKKKKNNSILKFTVRLPTENEWRYAALGGLPTSALFPWPGDSIKITTGAKRDIGKWQANVKSTYGVIAGLDYSTITTPVFSYWPNGYKLFNMAGNVSEWTATPGKALGGDFDHTASFAQINHPGLDLDNTKAACNVGFRYVIEIEEIEHNVPIIQKLNAKKIEKQMVKVDTNLYASKFETSNEWFNTFINQTGLLQNASNDSAWLLNTPYTYRLMYSKYEGTANFPVVNISYKAAIEYCKWLSTFYNSQAKRKFKKVEFTLPSAQEWAKAATAGKPEAFPWHGNFMRNSRGVYLANYFPEKPIGNTYLDSSQARLQDNLEFTGPVNSYFDNKIGLYNCAGNVAEMLINANECMGGSWNSTINFLKIYVPSSTQSTYGALVPNVTIYNGANTELGFRVFMHVLEQ